MKSKIYLLMFITSLAYAGCKCDCDIADLNSIYFAFSSGGANGFPIEEIDTITVYKLTKNTTTKLDSTFIYDRNFSLSESGGFAGGSFWDNDYLIKTQGTKEFMITEIQIEAAQSNDRCKCFENTMKKLKVNGTAFDFSGKRWNECNVELKK